MSDLPPHNAKDGFFDQLRAGFAYVAQAADHVRIDEARLALYAAEVAEIELPDTFDDDHHYVSGVAEADYGYVLLLDAINFGSGYRAALEAEGTLPQGGSFYFTMAQRLKERFDAAPVTPYEAAHLPLDEVVKIFGFTAGEKSQELARHYHRALNEIGTLIDTEYRGYSDFVAAAKGSVESFMTLITRCDMFCDEAAYKGHNIGLYKRAQITAADLHLSAMRSGQTLFQDIDLLTMFADNAVPHVLRRDGVLRYSNELAAHIDSGKAIKAGSAQEVEVRACAAHAVELIAQQMNMKAMDVDHRLWHRSEEKPYRKGHTHRTETLYY